MQIGSITIIQISRNIFKKYLKTEIYQIRKLLNQNILDDGVLLGNQIYNRSSIMYNRGHNILEIFLIFSTDLIHLK